MIVQTLTLVIFAGVGFAAGGFLGASALLGLWGAVLFASRYLGTRDDPAPERTPANDAKNPYANIDAVNDRLEEVARDRHWSLEKRLEIARIACENPSVPFEELESLYDRGYRAAPEAEEEDTYTKRECHEPCWKVLP